MTRLIASTVSAFAFVAILAAPPAFAHGDNDKDHVTKTYDLSGFDALELGGVYELDVTVGGDDFSISIEGHQKQIEKLITDVKSDVLTIDSKQKKWKTGSGNKQAVQLTISMPDLISLEIGGVATGSVKGIDTGNFKLTVGGVADLDLSGTCGSMEAEIGGVGDVDARDLECKDVEVSLGGVGDVTVYASKSVDASVGGIGSITVYGKPSKVEKTKGFLSSVTIK